MMTGSNQLELFSMGGSHALPPPDRLYETTVAEAQIWFRDLGAVAAAAASELAPPAASRAMGQYENAIVEALGYDSTLPETRSWLDQDIRLLGVLASRDTAHPDYVAAARRGHDVVLGTWRIASAEEEKKRVQAAQRAAEAQQQAAAEREQALNEQLRLDSKTSLVNDHGYQEIRERVFAPPYAERRLRHQGDSALSVGEVNIDLTLFKQVNDRLGHAIGDELLKLVASEIDQYLREEDPVVIARSGEHGDEFKILFGEISLDAFELFLDRLQTGQEAKVQAQTAALYSANQYMWDVLRTTQQELGMSDKEFKAALRVESVAQYNPAVRTGWVRDTILYVDSKLIGSLRNLLVLSAGGAHTSEFPEPAVLGRQADAHMYATKGALKAFMATYLS